MIYALAISLILLSVMVIGLFITMRNTPFNWVSYFIIPFLLFNIGFSWHTVNDLLGRATETVPQGQFEVLSVFTKKPFLYIVVKEENKEEPTFHKIPDTKENRKKGAEAKQLLNKGVRLTGEINEDQTAALQIYKWNHQQAMPKQ